MTAIATLSGHEITAEYADQFWGRVQKSDGCWEWQGFRFRGYGTTTLKRRNQQAHRVAYAISKGDPGRLLVCHSCDNRPCCNPAHLWLGTAADNNRDAAAKGRHGRKKIDVPRLLELRADGLTYAELATVFGCNVCNIGKALRNAGATESRTPKEKSQ